MSRNGLPPKPPPSADTWQPSPMRDATNRSRFLESTSHRRPDDMYQFRGNEYSNSNYDETRRPFYPPDHPRRNDAPSGSAEGDSYRPASNGFTFSMPPPHSLDMSRNGDTYRPPPPSNNLRSEYRNDNRNGFGNGRLNAQAAGPRHRPQRNDGRSRYPNSRPQYVKEKTAERKILLSSRNKTPELMAGMEDDGNKTKYLAVEDLSDSDEIDMDLSDSGNDSIDGESSEQPKKKQARTDTKQSTDGESVPRWSNPDPYSVLPPIDESQRKNKDVVKLIRKARVTATSDTASKPESTSDDFISFDFGDSKEDESPSDGETEGRGVFGAPTGPKAFSHRDTFHQQSAHSDVIGKNDKKHASDMVSDPALGNRKRTFDDEIKGPSRPVKRPGKPPPAGGQILHEWRALPGTPSTPWCDIDHSQTAEMGIWLHKEITDFYNHFKHKEYEDIIRGNLVKRLDMAVQRHWPDYEIHPFGSFVAGLYLPTADMDLVCTSAHYMNGGDPSRTVTSRNMLFKVARFLRENKFAADDSVEIISSAKVPLVKYVDYRTGLRVDISFENDTGLIANRTFREWKAQYPAMPILVTLIKQFLAMRGLNEPVNGGIGGFAVTCLVVSLLQLMPQVQSRNMIPEHHLGEILLEFFDLYGNELNVRDVAIVFNPPGYAPKHKLGQIVYKRQAQEKFSIIDPNKSSNDITGGSANTPTIRNAFSVACKDLRKRMADLAIMSIPERAGCSILDVILGGNYTSFDIQRDHMWKCYQALKD